MGSDRRGTGCLSSLEEGAALRQNPLIHFFPAAQGAKSTPQACGPEGGFTNPCVIGLLKTNNNPPKTASTRSKITKSEFTVAIETILMERKLRIS